MISSVKLLANSIYFIYYIHFTFYQKILTWRNKCPPPKKTINCVTMPKQGATITVAEKHSKHGSALIRKVSHLTQSYHSQQFQNLFNIYLTLILSSEMGCSRQGLKPQCSMSFLFVPCIFLGETL
jgi:hypothetical protein